MSENIKNLIPREEIVADDTPSLKDFFVTLEKKIKSNKTELERQQELARLQEMWKEYTGEDKLISSYDIAERIKNRPEEVKIMTGFPGVDRILDGMRLKQVVVISAATKSGKTSFCVDMTSNIKKENPVWLPFEESAEELVQKFLDRKEQPPLFYTPSRIGGNTLLWVEKKIIEAKAKYDSKVIFIDHLHYVVDMGENMSVQIGKTMRQLKQIAKRWSVVIVLIAHLKKTKVDEQPDLEDLRDSSFIAQEADTVIMLWRKTERIEGKVEISNAVNVSIQANRRTGKTGNLDYNYINGHFLEVAKGFPDDPVDTKSW